LKMLQAAIIAHNSIIRSSFAFSLEQNQAKRNQKFLISFSLACFIPRRAISWTR
jgi:hypothetical protein